MAALSTASSARVLPPTTDHFSLFKVDAVRKTKRLPREALAHYMLDVPGEWTMRGQPLAPIPWAGIFEKDQPVEVEVGFGKGLFLTTAGVARPDTNFFGIEIVRKYQLYATERIALRALPNVRTCCADAKRILREVIAPDSVAVVHVFFPDPWWKNKHKQRLLFTDEFAALVLRVLKPGGILHFVTDVHDYFEMVTELLRGVPAFAVAAPPEENTPEHDMDYLTNFERKFRREGRPIHRSRYAKV